VVSLQQRSRGLDFINNVKLVNEDLTLVKQINGYYDKITEAFANNFKTQDALTHFFNLITDLNK